MKAVPVSPAAEGGTELHLFGNSAGEAGVEFGLKAFLIVEKAPWVKHSDGCSEASSAQVLPRSWAWAEVPLSCIENERE